MARMSVDDSLPNDTRLEHLAMLCGWTVRETGGALMLDVWPLCYSRITPNLPAFDLELAANRRAASPVKHPKGFVGALIEARLGRPAKKDDTYYVWVKDDESVVHLPWKDPEWRDRVYMVGAPERIAYLLKKEWSGRVGGLKSGESRANKSKHRLGGTSSTASSTASVSGKDTPSIGSRTANPSASVLPSASALDLLPVPVQEEEERDLPVAGPSSLFDVLKAKVDAATGDIGKRRAAKGRKARTFTPEQTAIATRVLGKLGECNGVRYTGADAHIALIVDRLEQGVHEMELRAIVAYCASPKSSGGKGWEDSEEMRTNLCPETLFGPKTHVKYLDPARTWAGPKLQQAMQRAQVELPQTETA